MTSSDLEKRNERGQNFMADFHNYTRMVGPRVTKFGTITHVGQERVSSGSATPRLKQ